MIKTWASKFRSLGTQEMSREDTSTFLKLMMDSSTIKPPGLDSHFGFQVTYNRALSLFSEVSWQAAAWIATITDRPGAAVMYLYAIRDRYPKLTMNTIAYSFPNGFLTDESLSEMWEAQKIGGANYLDSLTKEDFA